MRRGTAHFVGGKLVGSLGLFGDSGSKMLYEASEDYRKGRSVERVVILALNDNPNVAVGLYGNLGFEPVEQMWGLWKRPC